MNGFFTRFIFPMSFCGGLFTLFVVLAQPLLGRLKATFTRRLLLFCAVLFMLPVGLGAFAAADTVHSALAPAPVLAQPAPPQDAARTLTDRLNETPVAAPFVRAGQTLGQAATPVFADNAAGTAGSWLLQHMGWLYLAGAATALALYALRYARLMRRLKRDSVPLRNESTLQAYRALCQQLRLAKAPALYTGSDNGAPLLAGVLKPRIVLPQRALPPEELAYALRHELTHYRHKDLWVKHLLVVLCVVHWFNPMAYVLKRQFARVCEEHCDEAVAAALVTAGRKRYASTLLCFVAPSQMLPVSQFGAPCKQLKRRLEKLMHPAKPRLWLRAATGLTAALVLCTTVLAGCGMAAGSSGAALPGSTNASSVPPADSSQATPEAPSSSTPAPLDPAAQPLLGVWKRAALGSPLSAELPEDQIGLVFCEEYRADGTFLSYMEQWDAAKEEWVAANPEEGTFTVSGNLLRTTILHSTAGLAHPNESWLESTFIITDDGCLYTQMVAGVSATGEDVMDIAREMMAERGITEPPVSRSISAGVFDEIIEEAEWMNTPYQALLEGRFGPMPATLSQ